MNAFINKAAAAVRAYAKFRDQNQAVLASANDRFEKGVVNTAKVLDAIAVGSIGSATVAATKEAKGFLAKSGKVVAGVYLCEYVQVGIESLAVLTIEIRRDRQASKANSFAAKLEAEVAELRAAREARGAEMHASRMALEASIREERAAAEARWMAIATTAEQPIDWLRPLTAEQVAAYEAREANNQD